MVLNWTKSIHEEEGLLHLSHRPLTHAFSFAFNRAYRNQFQVNLQEAVTNHVTNDFVKTPSELHGTFLIPAGAGLKQCCGSINFSTYQTGPGIRFFPSAFPHAWHVLVWGTTLKTSYQSGYYASPATLSV